MQGQVLEVSITPAGDELASAHAAGATTLLLMSVEEFDSSLTGGFVQVENVVYEYDTIDVAANSIHLLAGLQTDAEEGEKVYSVPLAEEKWAMVEVKDFDEPISARVSHSLKDKMEDGVRDPEDQETVVVEMRDGDWTVVDLIEEIPVVNGSYITPETVPVPPSSDGNPPPSSPAPEVIDGIGAFYLRWVPPVNADPMKFEVHVSETPGFIPSADTLYTETSGYAATVRNLPKKDPGTQQWIRFTYEQPYFFKIIAKDEDSAAAASAESSGTLHQITGPDIAANTIKGENIFGETLTGDLFSGTVVLGSTISTGAMDENGNIVGARVDLGPMGIMNYDASGEVVVKFPTDPTDDAYVRAHFEMLSADVRDNFSMFGTNNQLAKGSRFTMAMGTVAPTAPPTISYSYDTYKFNTTTAVAPHSASNGYNLGTFALNPSQITSMAWNSEWGCWIVIQQKSSGFRVWRFTSTGAIFNNLATGRPWVDDYNDRTNASIAFGSAASGQGDGEAYLFQLGSDWYVWGPYINKIPNSWILDTADRPPLLSYDAGGDRWMLVQSDGGANGTLHVRRFTLNSGTNADGSFKNATSMSTAVFPANSGNSRRINGCVFGTQITASNRYAISYDEWVTIEVYDTSATPVRKNTEGAYEEWPKATSSLGFAHNGTQFASVDSTGLVTLYETWNWPQVSTTAWVGASAYDSDTLGDPANPHVGQTAGQHETPVGSMVSFAQRRRAKLTISMPEVPDAGGADDPNLWRLYYARQAATPVKTNLKLVTAIGSPTARTSATIFADPTGGNPPGGVQGQSGAVNNFPGGSPARIISTGLDSASNPVIDLAGDGSGRAGDYVWDATGRVTTSPGIPGEVTMIAGATVPPGWTICDGRAVGRTDPVYARLYGVIGTTYGAGDGLTTFNLPNFSGKVPRGNTRVASGGSDSVTMPDHLHFSGTLDTAATDLNRLTNTTTGGTAARLAPSGTNHSHTITGKTGVVDGANPPISNIPAHVGLQFIIKL